jgi:quinol monooxygenase YgiN
MAAAPPFVSYSSASFVQVPPEDWPDVYASLQTLKAHVQEYPGCQRFDAFVSVGEAGARVHCYTTWDSPEQLGVFLERGYTFERMLDDVAGLQVERSTVMEKIF